MDPFQVLQDVRTAGWTTNTSELDDIVEVLIEALEEDELDFVYSLSDALLFHNLDPYSALYRATFEVFMARSRPDDSDPDDKERLLIAKDLLEEVGKSEALEEAYKSRVEGMLKQVNGCLQNDLSECPPPGHPDRRETRKVYPGLMKSEEDEDEEMEGVEADVPLDVPDNSSSQTQVTVGPASTFSNQGALSVPPRLRASSRPRAGSEYGSPAAGSSDHAAEHDTTKDAGSVEQPGATAWGRAVKGPAVKLEGRQESGEQSLLAGWAASSKSTWK